LERGGKAQIREEADKGGLHEIKEGEETSITNCYRPHAGRDDS